MDVSVKSIKILYHVWMVQVSLWVFYFRYVAPILMVLGYVDGTGFLLKVESVPNDRAVD
jgi:hypothetical protein